MISMWCGSGGMKALFEGVYAPSTVGTLLREFTFGHARQLESVLREHLFTLCERVRLLKHPRFYAHPVTCDRCAFRRGVERSTRPRLSRVGGAAAGGCPCARCTRPPTPRCCSPGR